jgi:hypothetical protein
MERLPQIFRADRVMLLTNGTNPYHSPTISAPSGYLVVEGIITYTTIIRLSKPVNLMSAAAFQPVLGDKVSVQNNVGSEEIPVTAIIAHPGSSIILGYTGSTSDCGDCILRGTNIKPSFWP